MNKERIPVSIIEDSWSDLTEELLQRETNLGLVTLTRSIDPTPTRRDLPHE